MSAIVATKSRQSLRSAVMFDSNKHVNLKTTKAKCKRSKLDDYENKYKRR